MMLAKGVHWHDDWFAIETISPNIIAIGEPRFHYNNWNYLIIGETAALLFDTGPGIRDISEVVRALTDRPLTVLASHMHFDHTGNFSKFQNIAMPDLPVLRAGEQGGLFHCSEELFLGSWVGQTWQPCHVNHWWPIGCSIDLGGITMELLHTPGHSPDSIALLDRTNNMLLIADFIYPGDLYAQVPGSSLAEYLATADRLLTLLDHQTKIFAAHGAPDSDGHYRAPRLGLRDVADLQASLTNLRTSGQQPAIWSVNEEMRLILAPAAFAAWQTKSQTI